VPEIETERTQGLMVGPPVRGEQSESSCTLPIAGEKPNRRGANFALVHAIYEHKWTNQKMMLRTRDKQHRTVFCR
jgi:hypothetical protein